MIKIFMMAMMIGLSACSSAPKSPNAETQPDKVISRIDNLDERPDYIKESEPFRFENGMVISTGVTTLPGGDRVEAGYRIAQNNAKASIAGAIEQRLEFIFQNAEEGTALASGQARSIGAEASNLVTSSIRPHKNYWEKIATTTDTGDRVTQYKVFSTVTMPEQDFKKALMDAARRAQGKGALSAEFAKKVDAQWDRFSGQTPTDNREPAKKQEAKKEESSSEE